MKPEEKYPDSLASSAGSSNTGSARSLRQQKMAVALGVFLTVLGLYGVISYRSVPVVIVETLDQNEEEAGTRPINQNGRYYKSLFENDPGTLQESFLVDVKDGRIDAQTKSDIYFILHRYVDNGGNIYEPYDFIESHPDLHFLKEAESIYPESFDLIRGRKLPFSYTDQGMYAYLAYLETLEKNGYANITTLGTLVNQYAKMAYHKRQIINARAQGDPLPEYPKYTENGVARDREMAEKFQRSAQQAVEEAIRKDSQGADSQHIDVVFGAEQYASGLRYLAALHSDVVAEPASSGEIFAFITRYSYQRIPEFYFYVSLSNASTLLLLDSVTSVQLENALYPFLDISDKDKRRKQYGMVEKVVRAREESSVTRFRDLDIYSRKNITELGRRVPEFKTWLISNGWKEQDFDE